MKLVVQRVTHADVEVEEKVVGKINSGFMVLVGIGSGDTEEQADFLAKKLCNLRIFEDENEKMNLSIKEVNGKILAISQFTLYADTNSGNRPSFTNAEKPERAQNLYKYFMEKCRSEGIDVEEGIFGAHMKVSLINDGPFTIVLDSEKL